MNKLTATVLFAFATALAVPMVSSAAPSSPPGAKRAEVRQVKQSKRIVAGAATGKLTRRETRRLVAQQARIGATKRVYLRDGKLGRGERAHLQVMQNRASRNIYAKKHNRRRR